VTRTPRTLAGTLATILVAGGVLLGAPVGSPAATAPSGSSAGAPPAASPADDGPEARILSLRPSADGGVRVVSDVTLPAADAPALSAGEADGPTDGATAEVTLETTDGVLRRTVPVASTIRAELPRVAGDTRLTGEQVDDPAPVLRVRVPVGADLRSVAVRVGGERHSSPYQPAARRAAAPTRVELDGWTLGPSSNRLDVVVLGDGYTAAQQAQFQRDATAVADDVFGVSPFREYRDFVNVVGVFVPSAQSGADQPAFSAGCSDYGVAPRCCPDSATGNTAKSVDTRYDSTFCSQGIQRLLVPTDQGAVYADADAGFPAWEQLLVVVNDGEYGGSGGRIATTSTHRSGTSVMSHELGHSLLGLDDEYSDPTPGYPPCSDTNATTGDDCAPNVTDVTTRAALKWRRWVDASTPIPTTGQPGPGVVGLFKGAHYSPDRWYRSCSACLMRVLDTPLGAVGSEQLPLRLLDGPYGVSLVEPGSVTPSTTGTVVVAPGATATLALGVLSTEPAPGTRVTWSVDGVEVRSSSVGTGPVSLDVTGTEAAQRVTATVESLPGILHPDDTRLTRTSRTWTLAPTADATAPGEARGAATGKGRRYVRLGDAVDCAGGVLGVRLVAPRRAPRVKVVVLSADGSQVGRVRGGRVPGDYRLPLDASAEVVSAVVERRGAPALTVERTYAPCGTGG
jgi:hypothetical protein